MVKILINKKDKKRFEKYFFEENGCWKWKSKKLAFRLNGKIWPARRASWFLYKQEDPSIKCVYHMCACKDCVNPQHLSLCNRAILEEKFSLTKKEKNLKQKKERLLCYMIKKQDVNIC